MLGPRSIASARLTFITCTGCKKQIKSEICRIPTKYQRILPLVQYLRPEATMDSLFCSECYKKILDRWDQSRKKREATSTLSSIESSLIVSSSAASSKSQARSQDSIDKMVLTISNTPNWKKAASVRLEAKQRTLNRRDSSSASSTSFFEGNIEDKVVIQNSRISSTEKRQTSMPPSPTISSSNSTMNSPTRNEPHIEAADETVQSEVHEKAISSPYNRLEQQPILIDGSSESQTNYDPPPRKKPRVRIRHSPDDAPDPNIDINFHQRFNGG